MYRKNVYFVHGKKQNNFSKHEKLHPKRGATLIWQQIKLPSKYCAEGSAGELGVRPALSGLAWKQN